MAHSQYVNFISRRFPSVPFAELQQSLPSQIDAISPFLDQLMRFILTFRIADGSEMEIETAVREALANAIIHGNGENSGKRVSVDCRCYTDGEVSITVRDEGLGFDTDKIPDPTTPDNRLLTHGRGIYLMKNLMDEVSFENGGSVVRMRKKAKSGATASKKSG